MDALETDRLILEPWDERHRGAWRRLCRDPEVMRFIGRGDVLSSADADGVFDRALEHWQSHGFGWRSLLEKKSRAWLGFAGLNHVGPGIEAVAATEVEIGWWVVRDAWGHGYATEGAARIRDDAFARLGLARIVARVQVGNTASARVAQKIGMRFESEAVGRVGERLQVYSLSRPSWSDAGTAETDR